MFDEIGKKNLLIDSIDRNRMYNVHFFLNRRPRPVDLFRRRRKERGNQMKLLAVLEIETVMIAGNLNLVEKRLEVGIPIERVEQLVEGNILELRKSNEPVHEKTNVVVTRFLGPESAGIGSNLELTRLSDLAVPILETDIFVSNRNQLNYIHRSSSGRHLLLQSSNLLL